MFHSKKFEMDTPTTNLLQLLEVEGLKWCKRRPCAHCD